MSKIQEALRKVQLMEKGRESGKHNASNSNSVDPVATLLVSDVQSASAGAPAGKILKIDRDKIRDAGLLAPEDQQKILADQYRMIKRPLLDNIKRKDVNLLDNPNLIMMASAVPGDGKTFNSINLALSMSSERDTSVLLVDADVAKPHVSSLFDIGDEPGLIELLKDSTLRISDVTITTDVPGLTILPAGQRDEHAAELLASRRMAEITAQMYQENPNRVVIFDSPPLLITSEAQVLASLMGQIVLVVCANKTPQQAVIDAVAGLDESKALNLLLNQSDSRFIPDNYSAYGYGAAYGE